MLPDLHPVITKGFWISHFIARLSSQNALYLIPVRQHMTFAVRLPSDSTSRWTPLPLANDSLLLGSFGTCTL